MLPEFTQSCRWAFFDASPTTLALSPVNMDPRLIKLDRVLGAYFNTALAANTLCLEPLDGGILIDGFRIMTPDTFQRAKLKKDSGSDTGTVLCTHLLYLKDISRS